MKIYINILLLGILLLSSCSKSGNGLNNIIDGNLICKPYISIALSLSIFQGYKIDESTSIIGHRQEGNCLVLETEFTGGCQEHVLQLLIDENSVSDVSLSDVLQSRLSHDNTDQCEALVALEVYIDITDLEKLESNLVELAIENYNQIVQLTF